MDAAQQASVWRSCISTRTQAHARGDRVSSYSGLQHMLTLEMPGNVLVAEGQYNANLYADSCTTATGS